MNMRALALLLFFAAIWVPTTACAEGALAGTPDNKTFGVGRNQPTPEAARKMAMDYCNKSTCTIIRDFTDSCVVFFHHVATGRYFYRIFPGDGNTVTQAAIDAGNAARRECEALGTGGMGCMHQNLLFCDSRKEMQEAAAKIDREQRAKEDEERKAREYQERKATAQTDCLAQPTLTGGPWLSSTYKIGALDEARPQPVT